MAISAAELNIILSAKDKEFRKAMAANERKVERFSKNSQKNLSNTAKSFDNVGRSAKKLGPAIAAVFSVAAISSIVNGAAELENFSAVAGVSVERFQELAFVGKAFGVSQEKMADILKDVNDKFGDYIETGAGPLADFFKNIAPKIGLTTAAFTELSSDQKLGAYVSALQKANLNQDQMTFYMEAIASDSTLLIKAFQDGGAEAERLSKKLREAGGVMSSVVVAKSKALKEELGLVSSVLNKNLMGGLENVMPLVSMLADKFDSATDAAGRFMRGHVKDMSTQSLLTQIRIKELQAAGIAQDIFNTKQGFKPKDIAGNAMAETRVKFLEGQAASLELDIVGMRSFLDHRASNADVKVTKPSRPRGKGGNGGNGGNGGLSAAAEAALEREAALRAGNIAILESYTQAVIDGETAAVEMATETAERLVDIQEAYGGVRSSLDPLRDATLAYAESIQAVNAALAQGLISEEQAAIDREKLTENFQAIKDEASGLTASLDVIGDSFATAFGDMISGTMSVEDAFKRMAGTIISELIKIQFQQMQTGGSSGSMIGGLLQAGGDLVGGLLGNAQGGTVQAGRPSVVGEHGRELFVPSVAGRILSVPQSKSALGGGGGGVTVQQTINVSTGVQQTVRAEIQSMMPQIASASTKAVLNARRRGGSFAGAFS